METRVNMFERLVTRHLAFAAILVLSAALTGCPADQDEDGSPANEDCDDEDPLRSPDLDEVCDGVDNDCDEEVDEGLPQLDWWLDGDGDGVGAGEVTSGCADAPGANHVAVTAEEDCDDNDAANFPGNTEVCDAGDNDCDTEVDEGSDADSDGVTTCGADGVAGNEDDDCDDDDAAAYPGNTETCDAVDNDCDTELDEGFDADGDGVTTCGPDGIDDEGAANTDDDCNDDEAAVFPGAVELCDNLDNDCDDLVDILDDDYAGDDNDQDGDNSIVCGGTDCDDNDDALSGLDLDLDSVSSCDGDCNDENPTIFPGIAEFCDQIDNDCDGDVDEGTGPDGDGDGFDTSGCGVFGSDCDDTDPHLFPQQDYTSGYQRQCEPAVRPGFANSWAYARLNLPTYFEDPQTGLHYLYFRGYHNPSFHQFGFVESTDGFEWGPIEGPIFSESATAGRWDGRKISHPSVVYVPGKPRPYLMAYHAQDDTDPDRAVGIATATTAAGDSDGTFKRQDLGGVSVSEAVVNTSANVTAVDNERALHPALWFDASTGLVHMWYTGRFGSPNAFAIAHAACNTTTSDCGAESDWVKTDSNGDGDPDIWLEGDVGEFDEDDIRQVFVHPHGDPSGFFGYELEITYSSSETSIGSAQGDIGDANSWEKMAFDTALSPSLEAGRMDSQSVTGRGVRYDEAAGEYHMYYGTSVQLPVDGDGEVQSLLWGPGNFSGGASYIGHAINTEPLVLINSADCSSIAGEVEDHAPDTALLVVYDGSTELVGAFQPDSTGSTTNFDIQSTTFSASGFTLAAGAHTLTVVVTDEAGAERSADVAVTCP